MQNNGKKIKKRGFTLIEALIAISILTISIAGPITIASKGLSSAFFARDQITAFYLAQEAVEFVRNERDENNITGSSWLSGLGTCLNGTSCIIDSTVESGSAVNNCPGDVCPVIKYDNNINLYNYSTGNDSVFTRKVSIEEIENDREASVKVTLSWRTGINQKTFIVKEHIFNW